jgi:hypothetical protein
MFVIIVLLGLYLSRPIDSETVSGCTTVNGQRDETSSTSVTLSCPDNGFILVGNLTFGVRRNVSQLLACQYQTGDCITRTTYIGMECNGLNQCRLDLNAQYLHICKSSKIERTCCFYLKRGRTRLSVSHRDVLKVLLSNETLHSFV